MYIDMAIPTNSTRLLADDLIILLSTEHLHELLSDDLAERGAVDPGSSLHQALLDWARQNVRAQGLVHSAQPITFTGPDLTGAATTIGLNHPQLQIPEHGLLLGRDLERWTATDLWLREAPKRTDAGTDWLDELEAWYRLFQRRGLGTYLDSVCLYGNMEALGRDLAELMTPPLPEWAENEFDFGAYGARTVDDERLITLVSGRLAYFT